MSTPIHADPAADPAPVPAPSITAPALGLVGAVAGLLAGGWLMYSPWALGYTPDGADWTDATMADFWTGFGLAVIALVAAVVLTLGLVAALRTRGVITARRRPEAVEAPTAPAGPAAGGTDELTALLRPLVEALNRDNTPAPNGTTPTRATDPAQH